MVIECPFCGQEYDDRWGFEFNLGSKKLNICGECYRTGTSKADTYKARRQEQAKRKWERNNKQ